MAPNQGQGSKSAGLQRLALLGFGGALVVLFLIVAIAQGIGNPSVPSGAIAVVEDAPEGLGTITEEEFQSALGQAAAQEQLKSTPKPGDKKYDELAEKVTGELLDAVWIRGQGEEMGFEITQKEIEDELAKLKEQAFKTEKQYEDFLEESKFTQADIDKRVTLQILSAKIQEAVTEDVPTPSNNEIENFYEAAKATQFTTPESREIRVIKNKDKAKVEAAKAALEKDDSTKNWEKVAKEFSTDPTKSTGGLMPAVSEGQLGEPLDAAVAAAPQGELEGPFEEAQTKTFTVFEVMKITPEKVQTLVEVKPQISAQLAEQAKQAAFTSFIRGYGSRWIARSFCASDYLMGQCANFKGDSRPPEANPACYEADPKTPAEACPAPIAQVKPAQPGTVNPLTPEGQKLAQRPRPAGLEEASEEAATLPAGVPPTGVPPTGE